MKIRAAFAALIFSVLFTYSFVQGFCQYRGIQFEVGSWILRQMSVIYAGP